MARVSSTLRSDKDICITKDELNKFLEDCTIRVAKLTKVYDSIDAEASTTESGEKYNHMCLVLGKIDQERYSLQKTIKEFLHIFDISA
jgi:hypothetical protein